MVKMEVNVRNGLVRIPNLDQEYDFLIMEKSKGICKFTGKNRTDKLPEECILVPVRREVSFCIPKALGLSEERKVIILRSDLSSFYIDVPFPGVKQGILLRDDSVIPEKKKGKRIQIDQELILDLKHNGPVLVSMHLGSSPYIGFRKLDKLPAKKFYQEKEAYADFGPCMKYFPGEVLTYLADCPQGLLKLPKRFFNRFGQETVNGTLVEEKDCVAFYPDDVYCEVTKTDYDPVKTGQATVHLCEACAGKLL